MSDWGPITCTETELGDFSQLDLLVENYYIPFELNENYFRKTLKFSKLALTFSNKHGIIGIVGIGYNQEMYSFLDRRFKDIKSRSFLIHVRRVIQSILETEEVRAISSGVVPSRFLEFLGFKKCGVVGENIVYEYKSIYIPEKREI